MQKNKQRKRSEESVLNNDEIINTSRDPPTSIRQKHSKDNDQDLSTDDEDTSVNVTEASINTDHALSKNNTEQVSTNRQRILSIDIDQMPSTSTGQETSKNITQDSSVGIKRKFTDYEVISVGSSHTEDSETEVSWTNAKDVANMKNHKCPFCGTAFIYRSHLVKHVTTTCVSNPDSKNNKETGRYKCDDCGRSYKHAKNLRHHQKHECQQKVTCPDCGKTMLGTYVTERHKQNHCIKRRRNRKKKEASPDELFLDDSSLELD
jgi:predicted RNA-binding Zn-ribbon protein involved in translation (DUF1610 family)